MKETTATSEWTRIYDKKCSARARRQKIKNFLLLFILAVAVAFGISSIKPTVKPTVISTTSDRPALVAAVAQVAIYDKQQGLLKLATIGKNEGVERAFIRQLIGNPRIMDEVKVKIGKKVYDLSYSGEISDKKAVKKWAQPTAHLLAIVAGYVDQKTGREIGIRKANEVACILKVESSKKFAVDIYLKSTLNDKKTVAEFGNQPIYSIGGLGVDYQATFLADVKDGIGSYEYARTPKVKQKRK